MNSQVQGGPQWERETAESQVGQASRSCANDKHLCLFTVIGMERPLKSRRERKSKERERVTEDSCSRAIEAATTVCFINWVYGKCRARFVLICKYWIKSTSLSNLTSSFLILNPFTYTFPHMCYIFSYRFQLCQEAGGARAWHKQISKGWCHPGEKIDIQPNMLIQF